MNDKIRRGSLLAVASTQVVEFDINNYLTIVALEDGLTASLSTNAVEYCVDGDENWTTLAAGATSPAINTGQTLSFRGNLTPGSTTGVGTFTISKSCDLTGNCMSLLFGDDAKTNLSLSGKNNAFYRLFYNCSTIKNVSSNFLPATTLASSCYSNMFLNCTSLEIAPELPTITLVYNCYTSMFEGCSSLTTAPELPATTLDRECYFQMFCGCTSLTTAPQLPATKLAYSCYNSMFSRCTSLVTAPKLPATTLAQSCYESMFYACTSLTTAPELPVTKLATSCYFNMFYGCSKLTIAPTLPATTLANNCYNRMLSYTNALPDCSNINFSSSTVVASGGLKGLFWGTKVTDSDLRSILPINSNGKYYLPATTLASNCYEDMFRGCKSLTTAPELPATTLADCCYRSMFAYCTSLTTAPELPATKLADYCYSNMFNGCSKLTTAPELSATTLANYCYQYMFEGCTSLTTAPELPATTLASNCYEHMFRVCESLTTAPELPATTLADYCYRSMFQYCSSLTTAPELPATTLATYCYGYMFNGCSKLNYIKAMFTTTPSSSYTNNWVYGVASSGTFVKNKNATWSVTGTSGIPSGWTVELFELFTPQQCLSLSIEADDITGKATSTTVYYTATVKGLDGDGNTITKTITGEDTVEVGQNTSTTNSVTKTVSYTYMGVTATTTITQGVYISSSYSVNLNSQWQLSTTVSSPSDITVPFDGIYESYSNKGVNSSGASMYINIDGYTNFKFYIRSYAESNYDYVMVSQLDKTLTYSSSYSDTTLVKAHTRGKQQSGTALSNYTLVEFTNIDGGAHTIQIIYRKDSSQNSGDDRGYVLIPRNQ